jgi:hypothetical protein
MPRKEKSFPPAAPASTKFSNELLDQTIELFQPHAERTLTREDAREMMENLTGFVQVLIEWHREEAAAKAKGSDEKLPEPHTLPKVSKHHRRGGVTGLIS